MRTIGRAFVSALAFSLWGSLPNGWANTEEPMIYAQETLSQNQPALTIKPLPLDNPATDNKSETAMQALGFELGSRRADVLVIIEKMQLPVEDLGSELRAKGQILGMNANISWAFRNDRLYTIVSRWIDITNRMTLHDNDVYRALSDRYGAIDEENSGTSYVRWTNESSYVELSYAQSKLKVRNAPHQLTLTAKLYTIPAIENSESQ